MNVQIVMGNNMSQYIPDYTLPPLENHYPHPGWPSLIGSGVYRGDVCGAHVADVHQYVIQRGAQSEQFFYQLIVRQQEQIDQLKKRLFDLQNEVTLLRVNSSIKEAEKERNFDSILRLYLSLLGSTYIYKMTFVTDTFGAKVVAHDLRNSVRTQEKTILKQIKRIHQQEKLIRKQNQRLEDLEEAVCKQNQRLHDLEGAFFFANSDGCFQTLKLRRNKVG